MLLLPPQSEKRKRRLQRMLDQQHHRCFYCDKYIDLVNGTIDHVIPRSKGGSERAHNLVAACSECNYYKANFRTEGEVWKWAARSIKVVRRLQEKIKSKMNETQVIVYLECKGPSFVDNMEDLGRLIKEANELGLQGKTIKTIDVEEVKGVRKVFFTVVDRPTQ